MGVSKFTFIVWGFLLSATAGNPSKGVWNVRSYNNYDVVELEKQFEADWNSVQDPLEWMNDLLEPNSPGEESDETSEDDTESTSSEDESMMDSVDGGWDFVERFYDGSSESSESHETRNHRSRGNRHRDHRKEDKNWLDSDRTQEDSVSTSEEYESTSNSESNDFIDSSEETSEGESDSYEHDRQRSRENRRNRYRKRNHRKGGRNWFQDDRTDAKSTSTSEEFVSDSDSETSERYEGIRFRKRHHKKGHVNRRKSERKPWMSRRHDSDRSHRRFRNPHGSKEQILHPPKTGRWLKVWQKFNSSKPAQAGRWAAMYNRTRGYWNREKDGERVMDGASRRGRPSGNLWWKLRNLHNLTHPWNFYRNHTLGRIHNVSLVLQENVTVPERWLLKKVIHVCNYLRSERHGRYMQHKNNTNSRDYRLDLAEGMRICCQKEFEEKFECFREITRARIDEFCRSNSSVPFRPWKLGQNPRAMHKIKPKCCHPEGDVRYNCFNRTHQILLKRYNMTQPVIEPPQEEEQVEVEELPEEVPEVMIEEAPVLRTPTQRGRGHSRRMNRRKNKKEHKSSPKQNVKTTCCNLGKEYGAQLDREESEVRVCNKLARKLSHKYRPKVICHMAMGRCCIGEARKQRERSEVQVDPPVVQRGMTAMDPISLRRRDDRRYLKMDM